MPACILTLETSGMPEDALEALIRRLPAARRERLFRLRPAQQRESAGAAALACCALQRALSAVPVPVSLTVRQLLEEPWFVPKTWPVDDRGKPFASGVETQDGRRYVSLSHSDGLAAAAAGDTPVGLDVQRLTSTFTAPQLERFCRRLHPEEAASLCSFPEDRKLPAFCRLWTGKESVLKLIGLGLRCPLNRFAVPLEINPAQIAFFDRRIRIDWYDVPGGALALSRYCDMPTCFVRPDDSDTHDPDVRKS